MVVLVVEVSSTTTSSAKVSTGVSSTIKSKSLFVVTLFIKVVVAIIPAGLAEEQLFQVSDLVEVSCSVVSNLFNISVLIVTDADIFVRVKKPDSKDGNAR